MRNISNTPTLLSRSFALLQYVDSVHPIILFQEKITFKRFPGQQYTVFSGGFNGGSKGICRGISSNEYIVHFHNTVAAQITTSHKQSNSSFIYSQQGFLSGNDL
jgi:hypothetical protein